MYVKGVSLFRESPVVFEVAPWNPCLNVTSNRETIHDNLQHDSNVHLCVCLSSLCVPGFAPLASWNYINWISRNLWCPAIELFSTSWFFAQADIDMAKKTSRCFLFHGSLAAWAGSGDFVSCKAKANHPGEHCCLENCSSGGEKKQKPHATVWYQANILRDLLGETSAGLPREMTSALVVITPVFNSNEWVWTDTG